MVDFVKIIRTVFHALLVGLAPEQIGDQWAGIGVVRLFGDQHDGGGRVNLADTLHCADGCRGIADDDVFHVLHLSS